MHGGKIALYVIAILWTVVTLFPVVVTVMASFKTNSEIYLNLLSFPKKIMFQNYISANKTADALNTIKNSLVVATLTTVFNTVVGMMAAYILSRKDYKFLKWVYVFFMIGVMVPVHCTLIPINNSTEYQKRTIFPENIEFSGISLYSDKSIRHHKNTRNFNGN